MFEGFTGCFRGNRIESNFLLLLMNVRLPPDLENLLSTRRWHGRVARVKGNDQIQQGDTKLNLSSLHTNGYRQPIRYISFQVTEVQVDY